MTRPFGRPLRRGTIVIANGLAAEWTATNPVLLLGELGIETDTNKAKIGDGSSAWNTLAYVSQWGAGGGVSDGDKGDITVSGSGAVWTIDLALNDIIPPTGPVDFDNQQATNFVIENRTSDPGSPTAGRIWLRTDL